MGPTYYDYGPTGKTPPIKVVPHATSPTPSFLAPRRRIPSALSVCQRLDPVSTYSAAAADVPLTAPPVSLPPMADGQSDTPPSLPEQYALKEKEENLVAVIEAVDVKEPEKPVEGSPEEVPVPLVEVPPTDITPVAAEESTDATADEVPSVKAEDVSAAADAVEETTEASEEGNSGDAEAAAEAPEIKLETAPADFRFPTTNQTRHCFTRYIEYHRCVAAKGEGAPECDKFAKSYRSLCPGEWIDRWNEQRENGTFPGPL